MADLEGLKVSKDYHVDIPFANQKGFFLKGINSLDWGPDKGLHRHAVGVHADGVLNVNRHHLMAQIVLEHGGTGGQDLRLRKL